MAALTEKQRRYVLAMLSDPLGMQSDWARAAGYDTKDPVALRVTAHRTAHNEGVKEAAREEARRHLDTIGPVLGIGVMFQIAKDPKHKRQLDAAIALANRAGFHERTEHKVTVEHVDDQRLLVIAEKLAAELGTSAAKLIGNSPVIEGEVVGDGSTVDAGGAQEGTDLAGSEAPVL